MQTWMYVYGAGDRPLREDPSAWTEADEAVFASHCAMLRDATVKGTVIVGGRPVGPEGPAVVIFEAVDEAEATAFMESDPFISEGLFTAELYPFSAPFVRGEMGD